jgi:hypothetical protein
MRSAASSTSAASVGWCSSAGVVEIGQQREVQVRVAVREEAHLERIDQRLDAGRVAEHRRHDDQRARLGRDAVRIVHPRQRLRLDEQRDEPVDERHRELAGRQQQRDAEQHLAPPGPAGAPVRVEQRPATSAR